MNAAIYVSNPSMLGSKLFNQIKEIKSYKGLTEDGLAKGLTLTLDFGEVNFNIMPSKEIKEHLEGFAGFVQENTENEEDRARILSRIHQVQLVLGGIFTVQPGCEAQMESFVFDLKEKLNGLLFMNNSIFE